MHILLRTALDAVTDPDRLAALAGIEADDGPDAELDELARAASVACRTPVGIVTVLDANRQWNVGRHGTDLAAVPVGLSMCAHVVASGTIVASDLRFDERFCDHPFVTAGGGLRFYAGVPVRVGDVIAGALAVADVRPRKLTPHGRSRLGTLAVSASAILQARLTASAWPRPVT